MRNKNFKHHKNNRRGSGGFVPGDNLESNDSFKTEEDSTLSTDAQTPSASIKDEYQVEGRNAVTHLFQSNRAVDKLYIASGDRSFGNIIAMAKEAGVPIVQVSREKMRQMAITPKFQGVIALTSPQRYATIDEIFEHAKERNHKPFIIALDGIVDPHNLGAILRTANAAGADGVIIPKHRSVGLTATVAKVSAGAVEHTPVARVTNLSQTLDELKERGVWVYGAGPNVTSVYTQTDMSDSVCIVIGNEGFGISRHITQKCDFLVSIPMVGEIESLNASVAAALLMYEVVRQRKEKAMEN
ncbi:MAG: 23S rRNA (guanosine(2251)-2'-O)-methyltransferase RlmB [Clostridiales bacterium]|jgi:23S rRNA (guanosine2251-2'-O)-methyltransferase|nr:23S rRNA (guanosine(2251)-2'-O)-methyltransferase RlmB [Clostridiales bacterium]